MDFEIITYNHQFYLTVIGSIHCICEMAYRLIMHTYSMLAFIGGINFAENVKLSYASEYFCSLWNYGITNLPLIEFPKLITAF